MFLHYQHHEIDKAKWDACIDAAQNSLVYANSWYLDIVSPHWEAFVYGDYNLVFPVTVKKKFGIKYLCNPFFVQQLGLFYLQPIDDLIIPKILNKLCVKYKLIEINLNSKNLIKQDISGITIKQNFVLNLNQTYNVLFNHFKGNCRRNIRLAQKNNFQIKYHESIENIILLFKNNKGKIFKHYTHVQYSLFVNLFNNAQQRIFTESLGVYNQRNQLIAGAIFFIYNNKITYVFSGISDEGRSRSAMFALFDSLIKKYSNQNLILDFEGGNSIGMASFYEGFGAKNEPFYHFKHVAWPLKFIK